MRIYSGIYLFVVCLLISACTPPDFIEIGDGEFISEEPFTAPVIVLGKITGDDLDSIQFISNVPEPVTFRFRALRGCARVELLVLQDGKAVDQSGGCEGVVSAPVDLNGRVALVVRGDRDATYKIEASLLP